MGPRGPTFTRRASTRRLAPMAAAAVRKGEVRASAWAAGPGSAAREACSSTSARYGAPVALRSAARVATTARVTARSCRTGPVPVVLVQAVKSEYVGDDDT